MKHHFYEVTIRKAVNGLIVAVGCKTLVFERPETALDLLRLYYTNPSLAIRKLRESFPHDLGEIGDDGREKCADTLSVRGRDVPAPCNPEEVQTASSNY
jgi:hypothetical protein